jgi:ribosomal protein S18 acetylase RimI-like enzyme
VATKYPKSAQTGDEGVALVRKIAVDSGAIYRAFESPDLGVDGTLELLTDNREPSGDLVLVQIKSGASYIRRGRFYVDADRDHFETWVRYAVPVVGIVCDPGAEKARWVDISEHLRERPETITNGPYSIEAPAKQPFSASAFDAVLARFRRTRAPATRIDATPNLLIRAWQPDDRLPTEALLQSIALDYPGFDSWLKKKLADGDVSKKVVALGNTVAAFSMWQAKDARNIKLQTFMVGSLYRGTAIGQHLLYHELRTWARDPKIERVHVTVSSGKADLIDYFRAFGFRVEGIAANRYDRAGDTAELVMCKHFVRHVAREPADIDAIASHVAQRVWGLRGAAMERFGVTASDLNVPAVLPAVKIQIDRSPGTAAQRLAVQDASGAHIATYDDASLMEEFFPLRIHLPKKRYIVVPIFKRWVDAMLSPSGPGTPLKLRVDNVYYCYPKPRDIHRGDLVVFYEPRKQGGRGVALGAAVALDVAIERPSSLHAKFANLGVYALADVGRHANVAGQAMAIRFGLFEPFENPVTLARIRVIVRNETNVQGLTPITRDALEAIRSEGLGTL